MQRQPEHEPTPFILKPQGAPRGLLVHYILYRISQKPANGYEILQDIDNKTNGSWRPGPGSVYPMLKKLAEEGLISSDVSGNADHKIFYITDKGREYLEQARKIFFGAASKWTDLRGLLIELIDTDNVSRFFVDGARSHFRLSQELFESKMNKLPKHEAEYILKEYQLELEKQLIWSKQMLKRILRGDKNE
ncbi:MAG: PadR family transcriptional regulator [Conexivisphaerales archaeon]